MTTRSDAKVRSSPLQFQCFPFAPLFFFFSFFLFFFLCRTGNSVFCRSCCGHVEAGSLLPGPMYH